MKQTFLTITSVLFLSSFSIQSVAATNADYQKAVQDAAFVEKNEITDQLLAITKDNPNLVWNGDRTKVLVSTWKAEGAYKSFFKDYTKTSDNPAYAVWVTTAPQVKSLCSNFNKTTAKGDKAQVDLRLKQYLGLNPEWEYDVFIEMWVDPNSLFRPCVDPQTNDTACNHNFSDDKPSVDKIPDYADFYENLYYKSFRGSAGVPWTGLGYTYDWGNPNSEIGASEFILKPETAYEIKSVTPTMEYCQ